MPDFPDFEYQESGYSFESVTDTVLTEYVSRNTRVRRYLDNRDFNFNVSHQFTDAQFKEFKEFVLNDLSNGADTYTGPYFVSDVEKSGTLQIVNGEYSADYLTSNLWRVSYVFQLKDRDYTDEESIYDFINDFGGFDGLYELIKATEDAVNFNNL